MFSMKLLPVAACLAVLSFGRAQAFTLGGRFVRESESDNGVNKTSDQVSGNISTNKPSPTKENITAIPLWPTSDNSRGVETRNITDSEADKFIETLKNQAIGVEPKNKNETHIASTQSEDISLKNATSFEPQNASSIGASTGASTGGDASANNASITVISSNATSMADDVSVQPKQTHMFQNESFPASQSNTTTTSSPNGTNVEKGLDAPCPSDCSAESCRPNCSFHCCLKEKSAASNDSFAGYYNQDGKGNVSGGLTFDSAKLEKMLLDTISEFTQKLPNNQQAQKLSEIMTYPSNHYAYAPSYDTSNENRYNFVNQMPNAYLPRDSNMYLSGGYMDKRGYPNTYTYNNPNHDFVQKSQINPSYSYKRNRIPTPNYPLASTHHRNTFQGNNPAEAYLYNPTNYQPKRFYRRARIYSPFQT